MSKLTNEEFKAIKRNDDGDIIWLGDYAFMLTEGQIDKLTGDDWQRYDEMVNEEYY